MAKQNGLGWTAMSVTDAGSVSRDIKNDCTNLTFSTPRSVQDVTGIDKSAIERIHLLVDFSLQLNGVFNTAANLSHDVFKTVPSTQVARSFTLTVGGQTLGTTPACQVLLTDYVLTRPQTGEFTWQVPAVLSNGVIPTWT